MASKEEILKEINEILEKFKEKGFNVKTEIGNVIVRIFILYKNYEKQKEIIEELSKNYKKKHKLITRRIKRMYEYYVKKLLKEEIDVLVYYAESYNVEDDLIKIKQFLERKSNEYNENYYLEAFRNELEDKFKEIVAKNIERLIEREKIQYEIFKKYLQYLNKEIDYDNEIEKIESRLNSVYYSGTYHNKDSNVYKVAKFIESKVLDMINNDNIIFFRIDHGIVLIMTYKEENRDKGYVIYKNNRFYLIDLRNDKIIDISNIIAKKHGNKVLKRIDEYDLNILEDLHFGKIYNYLI